MKTPAYRPCAIALGKRIWFRSPVKERMSLTLVSSSTKHIYIRELPLPHCHDEEIEVLLGSPVLDCPVEEWGRGRIRDLS